MHMSQKNLPVRMARNGRLSVPAKFRKALGLEDGGMVVLSLQDGEVRIRPIGVVLAEVRGNGGALSQGVPETLVEQFLADKRAEVAREELEIPGAGRIQAARLHAVRFGHLRRACHPIQGTGTRCRPLGTARRCPAFHR